MDWLNNIKEWLVALTTGLLGSGIFAVILKSFISTILNKNKDLEKALQKQTEIFNQLGIERTNVEKQVEILTKYIKENIEVDKEKEAKITELLDNLINTNDVYNNDAISDEKEINLNDNGGDSDEEEID